MATATQYYKLNEDTQLSTVQQLTAFSAAEYAWIGRTLTSWTDDAGQSHQIDGTASFDRTHAKLSGQWMLDRHQVSASIPTGHGHVEINMENSEKPLATTSDPWRKTVQLSNDQKATIWYDSRLSVDCIPDDDYSAKFMFINNESKPVDSQYVHNGKTAAKDFKISSEFYLDTGKAGLSVTTVNGNTYKFIYDDVSQPLQYKISQTTTGGVQYPFNAQSELTNPSSIASLDDSYGIISSIGQNSFSYCNSLSVVNIDNVLSINSYAFYNSGILSVRFPQLSCINASGVFKDCKNLKYADFPEIRTINHSSTIDNNFYGCTSLANVNLPQCSSIYGDDTFYNCRSLSSINISALRKIVTSTGGAFQNCSSLSTIYMPLLSGYLPQRTFDGCSSLISIDLAYVHQLNASTFKNCTSLTSIIGNCLTAMEGSNFENCINLSAIDLQYIKHLGKNDFCGCSSLTSANLPLLSSLGNGDDKSSFLSCNSLSSIHVDNEKWHSIENGHGTDDQLIVDNKGTTIVYGVQGIVNISNDAVISVDKYAFANHYMLSSVDLQNVSAIGDYAFNGATICSIVCPNIKIINDYAFSNGNGKISIDLPNLTSINSHAFMNNIGITHINMPMLTSLSKAWIFYGCTSLSSINAENIQTLNSQTFTRCSNLISAYFPNITKIYGSTNDYGGTFGNCSRLTTIDCENVSSIGQYAFVNCISLSSIHCPNVVELVGSLGRHFNNCNSLTSIEFNNLSVMQGERIFYNCKSISSIFFPRLSSTNNVSETFSNCTSLISAYIPALQRLYTNDFCNCSNLKTIEAYSLTSIDSYAFQNCTNLELINMSANMEVPDVVYNAFNGITHPVNVSIPYEKLEEYRANEIWARLEDDGKVVFVTTDPTAQLVQADGSVVYLTGKNLISEITQSYKDTTVAATIGYLNGEPA